MSIPKEYYDLIEETRDEVVADDISECASMYMDTLRMERAEPEQPVYELVKDHVPVDDVTAKAIRAKAREDMHVTADIVISLPDCDGMSEEFLLNQPMPAIAEYLEELSEEASHVV